MSGVEWAPNLPPHWRSSTLRWIADIYAGGTPDRSNLAFWSPSEIPWLNSGSVNRWDITEPSEWISEEGFSNSSTRWVPPGSVIIALAGQGRTKGMCAMLKFRACINQSMAALVPGPNYSSRFLQYWLTANYRSIRFLAGGDKRDGLNLQHIGAIQCPLPPRVEQDHIARHLDRETAKIDALVAKQQQLIATLRERREATCTSALLCNDKNVPLLKSHIPWLHGAILPAAWMPIQVRHLLGSLRAGSSIDSAKIHEEGKFHVYGGNGLRGYAEAFTHEGDFVLIGRQGALCGNVHMVTGKFWATEHALVGVPKTDVDAEWLSHMLRLMNLRQYSQTAAQPGIGVSDVLSLEVPLPPLDEQRDIASAIKQGLAKIDTLIAKAERFIELSKERRAALITVAVTGQLEIPDAA